MLDSQNQLAKDTISMKKTTMVAQQYLAKGKGSVGLRMRGGGIHFDAHTKDKLRKGEGLIWNYDKSNPFPSSLREQAALGIQGISPEGMKYTDKEFAALKNKGTVGLAGLPSGRGLGALVKEKTTPTSIDLGIQNKAKSVNFETPSLGKTKQVSPAFDQALDATVLNRNRVPSFEPIMQPVVNQENPLTGNSGSGSGSYKVSDFPSMDEMKMLLINGSAIT